MPLQPRLLLRQLMELHAKVLPLPLFLLPIVLPKLLTLPQKLLLIDAATNSSKSVAALASAPLSATAAVEAVKAAKSAD